MTFSQCLKRSCLATKILKIHAVGKKLKPFDFRTQPNLSPCMDFQFFLWLSNFFLGAIKKHFMTLFKKWVRLCQIHDLCISRWKNLIFSEGQNRKIEFLIFLPSSILLEAMKKKSATSSFPRYFYANLPDVQCASNQSRLC